MRPRFWSAGAMLRLPIALALLLFSCCQVPTQPLPPVAAQEPLFRLEIPAETDDLRTTVVLHGYGSNERDLVPLARELGLRGRVIALRAPIPTGQGWAWFPIDFTDHGTRYAEDAADEIVLRVAAELNALNEEPGELVVVGFSQGAMMAMMLAAEHPTSLDRAVALSGALPRELRPSKTGATVPVFAAHGTADNVVPIERAHQAQAWLKAAGVSSEFLEVPGLAHRIDESEIRAAREWLATKSRR